MTTQQITSARFNVALTVLRVIVGVAFLAHGWQKVFVYGLPGVQGAFAQMGAPAPSITGPLTAFVELFGGLALIAGLLTRLAGLGLAIVMLGAIALVHAKAGFFAPNGVEFVLTLLAAVTTLTLTGAGDFSMDAILARRRGA